MCQSVSVEDPDIFTVMYPVLVKIRPDSLFTGVSGSIRIWRFSIKMKSHPCMKVETTSLHYLHNVFFFICNYVSDRKLFCKGMMAPFKQSVFWSVIMKFYLKIMQICTIFIIIHKKCVSGVCI